MSYLKPCRVCGNPTYTEIKALPVLCVHCEQRIKFNTITQRLAKNIDEIKKQSKGKLNTTTYESYDSRWPRCALER